LLGLHSRNGHELWWRLSQQTGKIKIPMTSFCIFIAYMYINTEGIIFNIKITRWGLTLVPVIISNLIALKDFYATLIHIWRTFNFFPGWIS
jgi:hypothetical protein